MLTRILKLTLGLLLMGCLLLILRPICLLLALLMHCLLLFQVRLPLFGCALLLLLMFLLQRLLILAMRRL